ncbi:MAG: quinone oxidoreductase [Acidimicrobiia bacterium]|nr:quinone oxidoreductase [Acidimicrobiia bacterium]
MKAIVISAPGGPEVLEYTTVDDPTPGPGQAVVEIAAAGLNYIDTYHRIALYPMNFPMTPGLEGSGTIVELADDVTGFSVGDRVAWTGALGSYADAVAADASVLVPVPDGIEMETAAAIPLQGMTAHYLVRDTYALKPESRCLIHAGAGGVGLLVIQMAKLIGAEVFTTVSSAEKAQLASAAGADHVIRYDEVNFADAIEEIAGPRPLDVVYDGVGKTTFDDGLRLLRPRGLMALFGAASGPVPPLDLQVLAQNGSLFATRPTLFSYIAKREELLSRANDIFGWINSGDLQVRIGQTWPLEQAADAHRALHARATTGKTLLIP